MGLQGDTQTASRPRRENARGRRATPARPPAARGRLIAFDAFRLLLLAHLLGDFPLQPYSLVRWKAASIRGLLVHVAIQTVLALPVMVWVVPRWPLWLAVLALSHLLVDDSKIRLGRRGWAEVAAFFADQAVHLVMLWAIVQVSGAKVLLPASVDIIVRLAIALVAGAYAGAIVVLLVGNALKGGASPAPIPPEEFRRGIAERSAVVLTALALAAAGLPAVVSIGLAAAYLVLSRWLRRPERQRWLRTVVSVAWALIVSLWTVA